MVGSLWAKKISSSTYETEMKKIEVRSTNSESNFSAMMVISASGWSVCKRRAVFKPTTPLPRTRIFFWRFGAPKTKLKEAILCMKKAELVVKLVRRLNHQWGIEVAVAADWYPSWFAFQKSIWWWCLVLMLRDQSSVNIFHGRLDFSMLLKHTNAAKDKQK